jgi:hypothetical protein
LGQFLLYYEIVMHLLVWCVGMFEIDLCRDERDSNRAIAPLKPAEGAHLLDTSHLTIEEAVDRVLGWYAEVKKAI